MIEKMPDRHSVNREGDVVLIHYQDNPTVYARIEGIEADVKKDWYHVTLLFLTIPSQVVTWILKEEYINGAPFTMGGQPMKLAAVHRTLIEKETGEDGDSSKKGPDGGQGRVIPFKKPS